MSIFSKSLIPSGFTIGLVLLPISHAFAVNNYISGKIYVAGDQVCQNQDLYQAKWWAGAEDIPSDVDIVSEPWQTPWQRLQSHATVCNTGNSNNQAPVVEAIATPATANHDGSVPVELIATASDADGDALNYIWQQLANNAPSITIQNANLATAQVVLPVTTQSITYQFQITVSDNSDQVSQQVAVIMTPPAGNQPPIASANADVTEISGETSVQLTATNSTDPDGDTLSYQWQQISPEMPFANFDDMTSANPIVTIPATTVDTSFVFEVSVDDGQLQDTASLTIQQMISPPIATACPNWLASNIYNEGELAQYNNSLWRAYWWTQGEEPGTTGQWGVWRLADSSDTCSTTTAPDPTPEPDNSTTVKLSDLQMAEALLTDNTLLQQVKASVLTRDNMIVEAVSAGNTNNPENVQRVEQIISSQDWDFLFPRRAPEYTYSNFLKAIAKFPAFCGDYSDGRDANAICRKALATMFAHFTQETGGHTIAWAEPQWRQGLVYVRELGWSEDTANGYGICDTSTWQGERYPCAKFEQGHTNAGNFKSYFGRGAKQLSYNYNYGPFSEAMFGDNTLLEQPNLVADTWLNLASAVFFYVYPQPPKPSMLFALDGSWQPNQHDIDNGLTPGFGVTTQIINGGVECGGIAEHQQSVNRIDYYMNFADYLDAPITSNEILGCANMQRFDTQGSGALNIYWEQDWSTPNACQLVNYQTPYSALIDGEYIDCVKHYFDVEIDVNN